MSPSSMRLLVGAERTPANKARRLLTVHAHPDDEASKGASTVAGYAAAGVGTTLVTCTGGEEGEVVNKAVDTPEVRSDLAGVRERELIDAAEIIGFDHVWLLGYRDSGMPDSEANAHPGCFAAAHLDDAAARLVQIIRTERPQVIITYPDVQRGYKHPDHLRVNEATLVAFDRAGDETLAPESVEDGGLGHPWTPLRLFYNVWSKARLHALHATYGELGLKSPYDDKWLGRPGQDDRITTRIDVSAHYGARRGALLAHRTQVDPAEKFWFGLPEEAECAAYPYEDYILAADRAGGPVPADDLFAGLAADEIGGSAT